MANNLIGQRTYVTTRAQGDDTKTIAAQCFYNPQRVAADRARRTENSNAGGFHVCDQEGNESLLAKMLSH